MRDELFNTNLAYIQQCAEYFCIGKLPRHEWDDLINEVLLAVWQELERYDESKSAISTFIVNRVRNRGYDYLRKKHGRKGTPARKARAKINEVYLEDLGGFGRAGRGIPVEDEGFKRVIVEDWLDNVLFGVENGMVKMRLQGATLKEISAEIGVTESRVSQKFAQISERFKWRRAEISG